MKKAIILFTRVPEPGKTKTRLMPFLSGEQCAELHKNMIRKAYDKCLLTDADIILTHTPEDGQNLMKSILPSHFEKKKPVFPQRGKEIGERMENAFADVFAMGYDAAVLLGTDIPEISEKIIEEAFASLEDKDVVINPTLDGGYYLIGMKEEHHRIWQLKEYGTDSVFNETMEHIRSLGLTAGRGAVCRDIDTKEDYLDFLGAGADPASCVHCGRCTDACLFLQKYNIDLSGLYQKPELAYSCFLCGKCREVCPVDIDGARIALRQRQERRLSGSRRDLREEQDFKKKYRGILAEKNPYIFANYKKGRCKSIMFPGCNFTAFYPKTTKKLEKIMAAHGIGTVYDCCQNPVYQLGLYDDSSRNLKEIDNKLKASGAEEIITLCPNCYHFLKDRLEIPVTSVYRKLYELGEGRPVPAKDPDMFFPCPERKTKEMFEDLRLFIEGEVKASFEDVQCCGLGGCAAAREPELASRMAEQAREKDTPMYTYCASCVSSFKRKGMEEVYHMLPMILGVEEKVPLKIMPLFNRAKRKIL